jgi:hypothetical protein
MRVATQSYIPDVALFHDALNDFVTFSRTSFVNLSRSAAFSLLRRSLFIGRTPQDAGPIDSHGTI